MWLATPALGPTVPTHGEVLCLELPSTVDSLAWREIKNAS